MSCENCDIYAVTLTGKDSFSTALHFRDWTQHEDDFQFLGCCQMQKLFDFLTTDENRDLEIEVHSTKVILGCCGVDTKALLQYEPDYRVVTRRIMKKHFSEPYPKFLLDKYGEPQVNPDGQKVECYWGPDAPLQQDARDPTTEMGKEAREESKEYFDKVVEEIEFKAWKEAKNKLMMG
tara:strand:+ start:170 stop:703 length:534 start_codon:yes stop_codon:yes gene_type:complete